MAVSPSTSASWYWFSGQAKPAPVPRPTSSSRSPSSTRKCAVRVRASRRPRPTRCSTTTASSREAAHRIAAPSRGRARKVSSIRRAGTSATTASVTAAAEWSAVRREHAAQADEVAREADVDHLPAAVGQQLVAAGPAVPQDERALARLALADELGAGGDRAALRLERGQRGQLVRS